MKIYIQSDLLKLIGLGQFEERKIGKILGSTDSTLISEQIIERDEWDIESRVTNNDSIVPDSVKIDTLDMDQKIDSQWLETKLAHAFFIEKIINADFRQRAKKFVQRSDDSLCVFR